MKVLVIINDRPSPNERAYNAVRIANQLQKDNPANQLFIYLIADGVFCALANVQEPKGVLNVEEALSNVIKNGGIVKMCTSCGETRQIFRSQLVQGAEWTNLKTLTDWITESDKVISF